MIYDAALAVPDENLSAAVGEFVIAWAQVERLLLSMVKRGFDASVIAANEWSASKGNWRLGKRAEMLKEMVAGGLVKQPHISTVEAALDWLSSHDSDRQTVVHGMLIHNQNGTVVFSFQGETEPDVARLRQLAADGRSHAQALDRAR